MLMKLKNRQKFQQTLSEIKSLITNGVSNDENATPDQKIKRGLVRKGALAGITLILAIAMIFAMTAAWYSNIVQTTGLIFNVSDWGLDGNVEIQNQLTNAAPGESGQIPVEVYNSSDGIVSVNFNISKVGLYNDIADMRKRLYFYIEDAITRNGETTERVYINSVEDYSYTVLAKQKLILGDQGNGAALAWEWVYDVLGYYFYGTVNKNSSAQITEYLRPIVYDFDSATFNNGQLVTVDGSTTVSNFVQQLSRNDGYEGVVSTSLVNSDGKVFYPVSVDGSGTGVWIYCCNLSEIEYENVVDTGLGNSTEATIKRFQTTLNVLAEQKKLTAITVDSEDAFKTALSDDVHNMVVLSNDITLSEKVSVSAASEKIIDFAENTVTVEYSDNIFNATEGSSLTLMNGAIVKGELPSKNAISAVGSDVALSGLTISGFSYPVVIADQNATGQDTRMNIVDCKIDCEEAGIFIKGNGPVTSSNTYLTIENSEIICDGYYALTGNGSTVANGNWGTNIIIKNSTLQGTYSAIYHPQKDSYLKIADSTLKGLTPLAIKGGTVDIVDTKIIASNEEGTAEKIQTPVLGKSGYSDTGAGIYVETGYDYKCDVNISGDTEVTSYYNDAILLFENTNTKYSIKVSGGSYSHNVSTFLADGYVCEKDGNRYVVKEK